MSKEETFEDSIIKRNLTDILPEKMEGYSHYVITSRAIPDVRDGLIPVQRRLLYTSEELGLRPNSKHMKLARLSGQNMLYHPHGDSSASGSAVNMSRDWVMNLPLLDIHGNNGGIDGSPNAADRYISARQSVYAPYLLNDIKKNAVDMKPNFDNTANEPKILPASIPNAMINGLRVGLAVGFSSSIAPHNPVEMMDGLIAVLSGKVKKDKDILKYIKGPDFPTGCEIIKNEGVEDSILKGEGKIIMQSKIDIVIPEKKKDERYIEIKTIPYGETTRSVIDSILKYSEELINLGVKEFRDETQENDVSIKIICDNKLSEEQIKTIKAFLIQKTKVRTTFNPNNIMVSGGRIRSFTMLEYIDTFLKFRQETLKRVWNFDLSKLKDRLEIVEGLLRLRDITEEVIKIAKQSKSRKDMVEKLIKKYKFTERQATAISNTALYQLGQQDFKALEKEQEDINKKIDNLNTWLSDEKAANKEIIRQFKEIKKSFKDLGLDRRSKIIDDEDLINPKEIRVEATIESKPVTVVIKRDLTIQRIGNVAFDNQIAKYKNDDIIATFEDVKTTDYVVAFTKTGQMVTRLINDLPHENLDMTLDPVSREIKKVKSDDIFVGGTVVDMDKQETLDKKVLLISEYGYVKLVPIGKLLPNMNTRRYMSNTVNAHTLTQKGDSLVFAKYIEPKFYKDNELLFTVYDDSLKTTKETVRKSNMNDWYETLEHVGGNGVRKVNTLKSKNRLPLIEFNFKTPIE